MLLSRQSRHFSSIGKHLYHFEPIKKVSRYTMSGIFAVEKPTGVSSNAFKERVQVAMEAEPAFHQKLDRDGERRRKRRKLPKVKMGHGGTLDPAADGVLVLGVNDGTKRLGEYLECTKTYDVIAHFGCATTTYDAEGAILQTVSTEGVSDEAVEKVLPLFRGTIQQIPPIYSAIKIGGEALYTYARNQEALPRSITPRTMTISELTVGKITHEHDYLYPSKRASEAEILQERVFRAAALRLLANEGNKAAQAELESLKPEEPENLQDEVASLKSTEPERSASEAQNKTDVPDNKAESASENTSVATEFSSVAQSNTAETKDDESGALETASTTTESNAQMRGPILHIRATVSSGTYIRSLVHDMAIAMGTNAYVVKLTRSRQGEWETGKNVIPAADLEGDVSLWLPRAKFWMEHGPKAVYPGPDVESA